MSTQLFHHKPEDGVFGDCLRTSIAYILGKPVVEVPHFMEGGPDYDECNKRVDDYLKQLGLREVRWPMDAEAFTLKQVADWFEWCNPGAAFIATVKSSCVGNWTHAIVVQSGRVVLDPATGTSARCGDYLPVKEEDGDRHFWWIEVLAWRGAADAV